MQATLTAPVTLNDLILISEDDKHITKTYIMWVVFSHTTGFHKQGRNPVKTLISVTSYIGRIDVSVTIDNHCVQLPTISTRCGIVHHPTVIGDLYSPIVEAYLLGRYPTMVGTAPDMLQGEG